MFGKQYIVVSKILYTCVGTFALMWWNICWKKTSYMMYPLEQSITYVGKKFHQIGRDTLRQATYIKENSESFGTVYKVITLYLKFTKFCFYTSKMIRKTKKNSS
jgi:hypothetical protein